MWVQAAAGFRAKHSLQGAPGMGFVELAVCLLVAAAGTGWRGVAGGGRDVFHLLLVGVAGGA